MKKLKEKSFTANVKLNENYPDAVQTMLENLYNNDKPQYDEICLSETKIVSGMYYKGLTYGSISNKALAEKQTIEKDGYNLDFIFAIVEKQRDPFIDYYGSKPHEWCILEEIRYNLKLKFTFNRLQDVPDEEGDPAPTSQASKKKEETFILGNAHKKAHGQKETVAKVAMPF